MTTKTTIHKLTTDSVEIDQEYYIEIDGKEVKVDIPKHSTTYTNSISGRERLIAEQPNDANSVLEKWGKPPTVEEPERPTLPQNDIEHEPEPETTEE